VNETLWLCRGSWNSVHFRGQEYRKYPLPARKLRYIFWYRLNKIVIFLWFDSPLVGQGLIVEVSRSHWGTLHLVGLLWKSDRPLGETRTWQHTTFTRYRHPCPRRDSNPQCQQSSGRKSTPDNVRQLINMTLLPLSRDREVYLISYWRHDSISSALLKTRLSHCAMWQDMLSHLWLRQHFERLVKDKVISLCHVTRYIISFVIKTWQHLQFHVEGMVTDYVTETYLHFQCRLSV
jgi:hypothetical protein